MRYIKWTVLLFLAGCGRTKVIPIDIPNFPKGSPVGEVPTSKDSPEMDSPATESPIQIAKPKLSAVLVGQPKPNSYVIHLAWTSSGEANQKLFRQSSRTPRALLKELPPETRLWVDTEVVAGETYTYQVESELATNVATLSVPLDTVFTETGPIEGTLEGARLFLGKSVNLYTQGKDTQIKFNEIYTEGSTIETFPEDTTAAMNQNGRPGGKIEIYAQKLRGKLYVFGRGEKGGPGTPGQPGSPGNKGLAGNPAQYGCMKGNSFAIYPFSECKIEEGRGRGVAWVCTANSTAGQTGGSGGPGGNGSPGKNGGNSGVIHIEIPDLRMEDLTLVVEGGKAGAGGEAGPGGMGGEGGDPGSEPYGVCPAQKGVQGLKGPNGNAGLPGEAGKLETFCLKTLEETKGECH